MVTVDEVVRYIQEIITQKSFEEAKQKGQEIISKLEDDEYEYTFTFI
jgi:hypothetical protein